MTDQLPAPPLPDDVDLTDFGFMPLDVRRLRDSRLAASAKGDAFRAAVLLWCAAWHQVPAASLPDDDIELSQLAGFGRVVREWRKVRDGALHGWVKCSDGRLYHSVVAEKAATAWNEKREHAWSRECDRVRKENKRRETSKEPALEFPLRPLRISAGTPTAIRPPSVGIPTENALKGQGEVREKGSVPNGTGDPVAIFADDEAAKKACYAVARMINRPSAPTELMKTGKSWVEIYGVLVTAKTKTDPASYIARVIGKHTDHGARQAITPMGPAGG